MSLVSRAPGFVAVGLLAWGCAVYDSGLTSNNELMTGGNDSGGSDAKAGSSTDDGGKPSNTAGTTNTTAGVGATGGTFGTGGTAGTTSEAGSGNEGGENPSSGGTATAGSGGKAGSGSTGGSGGTATAGTGGSGGSGGSAAVVKCADHPITAKTKWVPTASSSSLGNGTEADGLFNPPEHMTDGSFAERWSSGSRQSGSEWIQIDFGATVNLTTVTLNVNTDPGDYPRHYEVRLTAAADPLFKGPILIQDDGMPGNTVILFKGIVTGRYLTVRQTMDVTNGPWWTIAEVLATCSDP
jgi:hypothetical protein